ncbi:MAG TPA: hypothetical protein VFU81_11020 [Thermomicrobiales bacterium]|nr:hypothetical protein [Thermomicrobiales bacterium]
MKAISRRVAIGMMALSLAFGAAAGFSGHASAEPIGGLGETSDCTYAGQTYSQGSVITQGDGKNYKCDDGEWVKDDGLVLPPGGSRYPMAPVGPAKLQ